jgi:hypothetical protein
MEERAQWLESLNPFRTITANKSNNHSLKKKLQHTFCIFFGDLPHPEEFDKDGDRQYPPYQAGVLDWLFLFSPKLLLKVCFALWRKKEEETDDVTSENEFPFLQKKGGAAWLLALTHKPWVAVILIGLISLSIVPFLIIQAVLALALTIAVAPLVIVVDLFMGPSVARKNGHTYNITPARQSFWLNPSTWMTGAVAVFAMSLSMDPAIFGFAAPALGIVQAVAMGMAIILLALSALLFVCEMGCALYKYGKNNYMVFSTDETKLLSYLKDRWIWMKNNSWKSIAISVVTGVALAFAVGLTIAFFIGVPADSFVSTIFDCMSQTLVSLIQAMSHLPGLEFLAASDAVLLPIAQILSAVFFILAPVVMGDSLLRFLYVREFSGDDFVHSIEEGSVIVQEEAFIQKGTPEFQKTDGLPIGFSNVFSEMHKSVRSKMDDFDSFVDAKVGAWSRSARDLFNCEKIDEKIDSDTESEDGLGRTYD